MCLTSSSQDHLQVMSSGDTAVVPSSIPNSGNKLPLSNETKQEDIKSSSLLHPDTAKLTNSISDSDLQDQSMVPSNSISNSLDNKTPDIREVTSLEGEEVGEMLRRDARSAFEITSFRPATDDLDKSGAGRPMSTDSLNLHTVTEKGESQESVATPTKKNYTQPESLLQEYVKALVEGETPVIEHVEVNTEVAQGNIAASSPKAVPTVPDESASKPTTHPPSGVPAQPGNGGSVQPNRFRRVNQYERGRWTIRDSLVTEEHTEGLQPRQQQQQTSPNDGSTRHQDSNELANGTTPPLKSTQRSDSATTSLEPSQLQVPVELSDVTGGGLAPESASDKDSSSIHMDRSSTAAETLSRNTSMSSIVAPEKSVDGDDLLRDIDTDSITGNQSSSQDQDVSDVPSPQPPVSSSGAVPPPSTTVIPREEQGTPSSSAALEDVDLRRVEHAMSFLQNELKQVLTSSSYPMLMEENRMLKDERTIIDKVNDRLEKSLALTKDELRSMKEENTRLKKELKELRCSLTRLAQPLGVESSAEGIESGTISQLAPTEDGPPAPPTSDDTSNSSQDLTT